MHNPKLPNIQMVLLPTVKSHSQVEANTSTLLPTILATVEPKLQVVVPTWSLPQPEAGPSPWKWMMNMTGSWRRLVSNQ